VLAGERSLRALLFFGALFHDVAKPECKKSDEDGRVRFLGHAERGAEIAVARAGALHLSNLEIERLNLIVRHHMRLQFLSNQLEQQGQLPSRRAIYRFFRDTGAAGLDLVLLALADTRGTHGHLLARERWSAILDVCRIFLESYWEKPAETVSPPPLLDGHEIMREFDLKPGPRVGLILEAIREAQATGKVTSREEALSCGRHWLEANP
jgi:hypothetical protein